MNRLKRDGSIGWVETRANDSRTITREGYVLIYCPTHPHSKSKGHVYEHRYIMERFLGRFLATNEHVHHKNGIRDDNRIENLELLSPSEHSNGHHENRSRESYKNFVDGARRLAEKRRRPRSVISCHCGCGQTLTDYDAKGRPRRFISGHNQKGSGHWRVNRHE